MYHKIIKFIPLKGLDAIVNELGKMLADSADSFLDLCILILNKVLVPIAVAIILLQMFFLALEVTKLRRERDGKGLQETVMHLLVMLAALLFVGGYGVIFGGLFDFITL